jgi:hypothetical protein
MDMGIIINGTKDCAPGSKRSSFSSGKNIILMILFPVVLLSSWVACTFSKQDQQKREDANVIYSRAEKGSFSIPPELKKIKKTHTSKEMDWIVNKKEFGFDHKNWQSDPSRVIYYHGRYHMWMIDMDMSNDPEAKWWSDNDYFKRPEGLSFRKRFSRILYLSSADTYHWTAHGYVPLGPEGSCYNLALEQANVVFHHGRFYMFTEVWTTNVNKYGQQYPGIACLVADSPEGPWSLPPGVDLLLRPSLDNGKSWDSHRILNPRHVYLNGKWFMYYKGIRKEGVETENGVAISDSLTGPYRKYEKNPLMKGHGHFCWRYKHGMIMIPNHNHYNMVENPVEKIWMPEKTWMHWSEDGIHFAPVCESGDVFLFGSLYVPDDPLFGEPVTKEPGIRFWGFESVRKNSAQSPSDFDVERINWELDTSGTNSSANTR